MRLIQIKFRGNRNRLKQTGLRPDNHRGVTIMEIFFNDKDYYANKDCDYYLDIENPADMHYQELFGKYTISALNENESQFYVCIKLDDGDEIHQMFFVDCGLNQVKEYLGKKEV